MSKMTVRLHKFIASAGIASRRKSEQLIVDQKVSVNGKIVTRMGVQIDPETDIVKVNGKTIVSPTGRSLLYALYKPKSCVTTLDDPQGRETIVKYFPKTKIRLFPIGRLDYDAEGLILLTNDGYLANEISHPSKHVWKQYFVKIKGKITQPEIQKLQSGPVIDGIKRQPVKIKLLHFIHDKTWLVVSLQEGLKNQIKIMFRSIGYPVLKIKRYSIGNIELGDMTPGDSRLLSKPDMETLLSLAKD
ncbi:MAG: rRNA pseudouridine synthase [Proteobacteria bacterium]|nr:rRNA pseudouridine synthase [Pseudomonadota bacterium]